MVIKRLYRNFAAMLERLKKKWKVNTSQLIVILCTFAIGGSACGYLARLLLRQIAPENNIFAFILYILLITLLWPICVILISIPFGQFPFFKKYLAKIKKRMFGNKNQTGAL
jgi:cell shape-determining protein MreD